MGIDKIAMMTVEEPSPSWLDFVNDDFRRPEDHRNFVFDFKYREKRAVDRITADSQVAIYTKPHISPFVRVELKFKVHGSKEPPSTRIETNPNNMNRGWQDLQTVVDFVFGRRVDMRITRLDLNADIEDVSVQYFRDALRVPKKRKSGEILEWKNKGIETYYIGRNPAKLRTYDKIQERKYHNADISKLPDVLTRLEWELHGDRILKCAGLPHDYGSTRPAPVLGKSKTQAFYFSELPILKDSRPFGSLEFIEGTPYYDFKTDDFQSGAAASVHRLTYAALVEKFGAQDAIRILNSSRHFSRDYKPLVLNNDKLKNRIESAFRQSINRFFQNSGSSVAHTYVRCGHCRDSSDEIRGCGGCGYRLCPDCLKTEQAHDSGCPLKGNV
jgi:hypothetical protein